MDKIKYIVGALTLTFSVVCNATIISGVQYTGEGKFVALNDLEWLSLDVTAGYSRTSIEDGTAGTWLADGWRYSTRLETEALLDSLWGQTTEGYHWDNFDGASWFINNFGALWTYTNHLNRNISETHFFFGQPRECFGSDHSCIGSVRLDEDPFSVSPYSRKGWFLDGFGLSYGTDDLNEAYEIRRSYDQWNQASMLVRAAVAVAEPSVHILLITGLIGLGLNRRAIKK